MQNRLLRMSQRGHKTYYKRWKTHRAPEVFISPWETRAELVDRARRIIERLRSRPYTSLPPFRSWEIREMLAEVATLRAEALARQSAPSGADIGWYVSVRNSGRSALLYGPLVAQGDALRALPAVRHFVHERNYDGAAFASFGTATFTGPNAPIGSLNQVLIDAVGSGALPTLSLVPVPA